MPPKGNLFKSKKRRDDSKKQTTKYFAFCTAVKAKFSKFLDNFTATTNYDADRVSHIWKEIQRVGTEKEKQEMEDMATSHGYVFAYTTVGNTSGVSVYYLQTAGEAEAAGQNDEPDIEVKKVHHQKVVADDESENDDFGSATSEEMTLEEAAKIAESYRAGADATIAGDEALRLTVDLLNKELQARDKQIMEAKAELLEVRQEYAVYKNKAEDYKGKVESMVDEKNIQIDAQYDEYEAKIAELTGTIAEFQKGKIPTGTGADPLVSYAVLAQQKAPAPAGVGEATKIQGMAPTLIKKEKQEFPDEVIYADDDKYDRTQKAKLKLTRLHSELKDLNDRKKKGEAGLDDEIGLKMKEIINVNSNTTAPVGEATKIPQGMAETTTTTTTTATITPAQVTEIIQQTEQRYAVEARSMAPIDANEAKLKDEHATKKQVQLGYNPNVKWDIPEVRIQKILKKIDDMTWSQPDPWSSTITPWSMSQLEAVDPFL